MSLEKFRRQLRQESEQWWQEGLIDAALYEKLATRYQFAQLEGEASNRFVAILMGLGAVLLGLAAITFVAANWQVWSRSLKLILLISIFIGVNATGFHLWRQPTTRVGMHRLGHGLLLLGALLLGANLGLVSQMFHQSGDLYELLVIWGLGVAIMAYSLRLTSLGVLSAVLIAIAYLFSWFSATVWRDVTGTALVIQHLPLVVSMVFIPLAYWCRSRVIFGLSAMMIAVSFLFNFKPTAIWSQGWLLAIALVLPPALLWGYSDRSWQRWWHRPPQTDVFQPIARSLALWFLSIVCYSLAFHWWWNQSGVIPSLTPTENLPMLIDAVFLGLVTLLGWVELRYELFSRRPPERAIHSGSIGIALLVAAFVLIGHLQLGIVPAIAFNVLLFSLALGLIRDGLALTERATFWGGMMLLVLGIISRTLEYDTELLLKAIVLAACGVGIIMAGLRFERRLPRPLTTLPQSASEK